MMTTVLILFALTVLFYKLSIDFGNKIFLIFHFGLFMILAVYLYPVLAVNLKMTVFSAFVFFLPIFSTLRLFEINVRKNKERRMRECM